MTTNQLSKAIYQAAHITGDFLLRSGQRSTEYFDKFLFNSKPELLMEIARHMQTLIPEKSQILAGMEMGAIPIATALSIVSDMQCAFVRKQAKQYGTCKLAEGAEISGKHVCVVEDVVTTGGQIITSVAELRERGAIIDTVLCVVLRNQAAYELFEKHGITLKPLFTMEQLKQNASE